MTQRYEERVKLNMPRLSLYARLRWGHQSLRDADRRTSGNRITMTGQLVFDIFPAGLP